MGYIYTKRVSRIKAALMKLFRRHRISRFLLLCYLFWWLLMGALGLWNPVTAPHCSFTPVVFFLFTPILSLILSVGFLIKVLWPGTAPRKDYFLLMAIVLIPSLLLLLVYNCG